MFVAIASAWPLSSASIPGYAPCVSTSDRTGRRELLREFQDAQRLAKAVGARLAEVPADLLFRVAALLVTDDRNRPVGEETESGDDGLVVGKAAVAVDLDEVGRQRLDVVERIRPPGMPRDERFLPGSEVRVDLGGRPLEPFLQLEDLFPVRSVVGKRLQLFQAAANAEDRLLELRFFALHVHPW